MGMYIGLIMNKLTYEFVKSKFEEEGYSLVSTTYINCSTKLDFICNNGHTHSITWDNFKQGQKCIHCMGNAKHTIEYIRDSFEACDYKLLTEVYINDVSDLTYECPMHHVHKTTWCAWRAKKRCPTCANISRSLKMSGKGNHRWRGAVRKKSDLYCEAWQDKEYKRDIRDRDGCKCLNPYCLSKNPGKLNIHHINYDKKDCSPKNLITVCHECNTRANYDRDWHQDWYQAILYRRYGYTYKDPK